MSEGRQGDALSSECTWTLDTGKPNRLCVVQSSAEKCRLETDRGLTSLVALEAVDSMAIQEKCIDLEEGQEQEGH